MKWWIDTTATRGGSSRTVSSRRELLETVRSP